MMIHTSTKRVTALLLCTTLVFLTAGATSETDVERIMTLEERVAALEERVAVLESEVQALTTPEDAPQDNTAKNFTMGEALSIGEGQTLSISGFDYGTRFRYSPAGGFTTLTLSAKTGYQLVCLFVSLWNETAEDLYTNKLLDASIHYGSSYTKKAQDNFFYLNSRGVYTGGLKSIGPNTGVDGCLLFAVPDDVETSTERISIRFQIDDAVYECVLRPGGSILDPGGAPAEAF